MILSRIKELLLFRKIQVHIITIFLFLLGTSSLIIIFFTYFKVHKEILNLSNSTIQQVSSEVLERLDKVTDQTELLAQLAKALIMSSEDISPKNDTLISYLLNVLKYDPFVYRVNIAGINGNLISAIDLPFSMQKYFISESSRRLPSGAKYVIRIIDHTGPSISETWEYRGTENNTLAKESVSTRYDPREDYWYKNIAKWPRFFWNIIPKGMGETGITLSLPIFNKEGKLIAIIGIDFALDGLSNFISHQQIGISGKAFVFDPTGNILLPASETSTPSQELAQLAYQQFLKTRKHSFLLEQNHIQYLIYLADFPLSYETKWHIAIVVPFNDFFGDVIKAERQTILISLIILVFFGILIYLASKNISIPIIKLTNEVDKIRQFDFTEIPIIKSHIKEIITLDTSITAMRAALLSFGRYIPKDIVKTLIQQGREISLGGEKGEITILFSDIENFTTFAESTPLEQLMSNLADYFDIYSKIILESKGTIDKYIGDGIMAFWGAPEAMENQADTACLACLRCSKAAILLQNKSIKWNSRFGIHNGEVIVGNIGTSERMNYTIIGDAVNTASRLENINKEYHTSITISESVKDKIDPRFVTRPLDFVAVKGKKQKLAIYELVGIAEGEEKDLLATPEQKKLCEAFSKAYNLFHQGKMEEAKSEFLTLHEQFPSDWPTQIYLQRLK